MEFLIVLSLLAVVGIVAAGKAVLLWLLLLVVASVIGYRAYRLRCKQCGSRVISGREMKFCNQCGVEQTPPRFFRIFCIQCKGMLRSELNPQFCNRCGFHQQQADVRKHPEKNPRAG